MNRAAQGCWDAPFYAVLNQADTPQRQAAGEKTKELLRVRYGVSVVLTTFSEKERA